jgi:hypothetical protein
MTQPRKPRIKPKPVDMTAAAEQMASQVAEYQATMKKNIEDYEAMVAKASADLDSLVRAVAPKPPPSQPECEWTETDSGRYLVMNVAAAEFFQAIFEQVGVLANELGKATKK